MKRVAILISGSGSNMVRLIESMTGAHPARPVLVLSDRPGAGGLARAAALGVRAEAVDRAASLDIRLREIPAERDELRARLNAISKEVGI
ncbi:MAG: phosphoribosylglycinamide formyltransferase, partial [Gemmobacter sp.]